nr:CBS domain-containing protein [uncultured Sphingomonas sp.]
MTKVRDLMTTRIATVAADAPAQMAAAEMRDSDTGSIPVMQDDRVIGMITDRDIAIRCVAQGLSPDCLVSDLMSREPVFAYETDDAEKIAQRMAEAQVRRLPVLDQDDNLIGMISLGDLSREGKQQAASEALQGVSAETTQLQPA